MIRCLLVTLLVLTFAAGCGKQKSASPASSATATNAADQSASQSADMDATLAELTRELHRTMIGHRLSGSFEEFVAIRKLKVPPPPPGKKYAISKQWKVVLVDQ